ncbi:MAG: GTP pyrophosphokinase family protein [Velocimicrobium sp.]
MELPIFYDEKEEWRHAILLYEAALKEVNTKIEILNSEFMQAHRYNPIEHVKSRIKSPESIAKKIRHCKRELTIENVVRYINDVAGIRIICSFTSDIYRIANAITKQNDVDVLKVKDYITQPKENGYTSYHMIIAIPIFLSNEVIKTKVEIQIRTIAMDFWASLEHKIYYKFEGNAPKSIRNELKECAMIASYLDDKMLGLNEEIKRYLTEELEELEVITVDPVRRVSKEAYGTITED